MPQYHSSVGTQKALPEGRCDWVAGTIGHKKGLEREGERGRTGPVPAAAPPSLLQSGPEPRTAREGGGRDKKVTADVRDVKAGGK